MPATNPLPELPSGSDFDIFTMTVTDATDSINLENCRKEVAFIMIYPTGAAGVNIHSPGAVENTPDAAPSGHTLGSFALAQNTWSIPFPVSHSRKYFNMDGIATTCVIVYLVVYK